MPEKSPLLDCRAEYLIISMLLVSMLFITLCIYWPALAGPFLLDDFNNLSKIPFYASLISSQDGIVGELIDATLTNGTPGRMISFFSFLIDDDAWPSDPWRFKYTNLLLHILNSVLIFVLTRMVFTLAGIKDSYCNYLSLLAAFLWVFHPLFVSTVMYVVQRMVILASLFTLMGLIVYLKVRTSHDLSRWTYYLALSLGIIVFLPLSILSKEIGINLLVYILVFEVTLLAGLNGIKRLSLVWQSIFLYLPLFVALVYALISIPKLDELFLRRDFDMFQRVSVEPQILLSYLTQIIFPSINDMGLVHDDYVISNYLVSSAAVLIVVFFFMAALKWRKKSPFISFCVLWFFSGHFLEAGFLPLELYFEHRNYLPALGVILFIVYILEVLFSRYRYSVILAPVMVMMVVLQTSKLSAVWADEGRLYRYWAENHPASARANLMMAQYELKSNRNVSAMLTHLEQIQEFDKLHPIANFRHLQYTCNNDVALQQVSRLSARSQEIHYRTGALTALEALVDNVAKNLCADGVRGAMISLIQGLLVNQRYIMLDADRHFLSTLLKRLMV